MGLSAGWSFAAVAGALATLAGCTRSEAPGRGTEATPPARAGASEPASTRSAPPPGAVPVVVELFTSQGCSSCPAADELLARLPAEVAGREPRIQVIPLAFHVDYWNYIGWADPFSAAAWSERQSAYAARIGSRVYTPQLLIGGQADAIGSDRNAVLDAITEVARRGRRDVRVDATARGTPGGITVDVSVDPGAHAAELDAWIAVHESGLHTRVRRGENEGRLLSNEFVVRRLARVARLPARGAASRERALLSHDLPLDAAWRPDRLGIVVFAQDPTNLHILAAATVAIPSREPTSRP